MMDSLRIGDRVEIRLMRDLDNQKPHVSQLEEKLENNRVVLHVPISYGRMIELTVGGEYKFMFFTEKGLLRFSGIVEKHISEDGFALMQVHLLDDGKKIQRRDFFRFSCVLPLKFSVINNEASPGDDEGKTCQGIIKDIGGGGICFIANESIDEARIIKCIIRLDNNVLVVVIGEILQKIFFPKSNYRYQYRVSFVGILSTEQEKIVQYIFNEQKRIIQRLNREP